MSLLLAGTVLLLHARGNSDLIPVSEPLSQFPRTIAGWTGSDVQIDQETLDVLGAGDFLSRVYSQQGQALPIGLFIGYFPTQRTGVTIHSPKHCLPGAGWVFESSQYVDLNDANGKAHRVGEYIIGNGESRQFVIYWYQAHGRSVANEYMAKIYMVTDAMRLNRTDGALVRVITPIGPEEDTSAARARAEAFTAQLAPCSRALSRTRWMRRSRNRQCGSAKEFRLCSCERQPIRMGDSEKLVQSSSIGLRWQVETDESARNSLGAHARLSRSLCWPDVTAIQTCASRSIWRAESGIAPRANTGKPPSSFQTL